MADRRLPREVQLGEALVDDHMRLTGAGRKQLQAEAREWEQTAAIIARFFKVKAGDLT